MNESAGKAFGPVSGTWKVPNKILVSSQPIFPHLIDPSNSRILTSRISKELERKKKKDTDGKTLGGKSRLGCMYSVTTGSVFAVQLSRRISSFNYRAHVY